MDTDANIYAVGGVLNKLGAYFFDTFLISIYMLCMIRYNDVLSQQTSHNMYIISSLMINSRSLSFMIPKVTNSRVVGDGPWPGVPVYR